MNDGKQIAIFLGASITFLLCMLAIDYLGIVASHLLTPNFVLDLMVPIAFGYPLEFKICFLILVIVWGIINPKSEMIGEEIGKKQGVKIGFFVVYLLAIVTIYYAHDLSHLMFAVVYPIVIALFLLLSFIVPNLFKKVKKLVDTKFGFERVNEKVGNAESFHWFSEKEGWINVENSYRHLACIGNSGSGKSYTIVEPIIEQSIAQGRAMLIFDFKMAQNFDKDSSKWALGRYAFSCFLKNNKGIAARDAFGNWIGPHSLSNDRRKFYMVHFKDPRYSHRVNPIAPRYLESPTFANEAALILLQNLNPSWIKNKDFWANSAMMYFGSIIWFLKEENYHEFCTIPHAISVAFNDHNKVLAMLALNKHCRNTMSSLYAAVKEKAGSQIAGVAASLQTPLAKLSSPEVAWVLSGDDVPLDINNPENPAVLCVGTDPQLSESYTPLCSLIITVATKMMNYPGRIPSIQVIDEAAQIYLNNISTLAETGRSNKIAVALATQNFSQFNELYGQDRAKTLIGNMGNLFVLQVSDIDTAKQISEIIGPRPKEKISYSRGKNTGESMSKNSGENVSEADEPLIKPYEICVLRVGETVGKVAHVSLDENDKTLYSNYFRVRPKITREVVEHDLPQLYQLPGQENEEMSKGQMDDIMNENYRKIMKDVFNLVDSSARYACQVGVADESVVFPQHFQNGVKVVTVWGVPLFEGISYDHENEAVLGRADFDRPLSPVESVSA